MSGEHFCASREQFCVSGEQFCRTGEQFCLSGEQFCLSREAQMLCWLAFGEHGKPKCFAGVHLEHMNLLNVLLARIWRTWEAQMLCWLASGEHESFE